MRRWLAITCCLALAVAGLAAWRQVSSLSAPFRAYVGAEQFVDIEPGMGTTAIGARLVDAGVVRDVWAWRVALWRSEQARRLKAGEYRFDRPMTAAEVVAVLVRGDVYLRTVTFREGLTIRQMAGVFAERGLGEAGAFVDAAADVSLVAALDPEARDLEGYLFPDTYALARRASAADLVRKMVARFESVWTPALRDAAAAGGLTTRQAVTLASLVEKETARPDERAVVSGVYHNRLKARMGLQCDPTVIYALERAGRYTGNLTKADLAVDSPYNTYRYAGLPPGPIAAPGKAALEAAVRPAEVDYLYFVSRNDGSHAFARTLAEHNQNVQEYQVRFFRQRE